MPAVRAASGLRRRGAAEEDYEPVDMQEDESKDLADDEVAECAGTVWQVRQMC